MSPTHQGKGLGWIWVMTLTAAAGGWVLTAWVHSGGFLRQLWPSFSGELLARFVLVMLILGMGAITYIKERRLRREQSRYHSAMEAAAEPFIIYDREGKVTYVNPAFTRVFGWEAHELLGRRVQFVPPEEQEETFRQIKKVLSGEVVSSFEARRLTKDGRVVHVSISSAPLRDHTGAIAGIVVNLREITKRKHLEQQLRTQWQQLEAIFDSIDSPVYVADPITYELLYVNKAIKDLVDTKPGDKCYEAFQLRSSPCEFCTNPYIFGENIGKTYIWDFQNLRTGRWFHCIDKAIRWSDGRMVRCEIAIDITERKQAEEALKQSEQMFRSMAEAAPYGLAIVTEELQFEYVNPKFTEIFGYSLEDLPDTRAWLKLAFPDDDYRQQVIKAWRTDMAEPSQEIRPRIFEVHCKDGQQKVIFFRAAHLPGGKFLVTFEDITTRYQAEQALRESEERFRSLFEAAPDFIYLLDPEGRILDVNSAALRRLGYSEQELLGQSLSMLLAPSDRGKYPARLKQVLTTGYLRVETTLMTKDGEELIVECSSALVRNADGTPKAVVVYQRDITDRKQAEKALKESEELYRVTFDSIPDIVALTRREDGKLLMANRAFYEISGYKPQEVLGRPVPELQLYVNPEDRLEMVRQVAATGEAKGMEVRFRMKDGRELDTLFSAKAFSYRGEDCLVVVVKDITEIKQVAQEKAFLEQQLVQAQKLEALGVLASGIAHDFNNILQSAMSQLELLAMEGEPQRASEYISRISDSLSRGSELVQRLLAFGRKTEPKRTKVDINHLVLQTLAMLERTIPKMIRLDTQLSEDLPPVFGDPSQLEQVLVNLDTNACDAMPKGGRLVIETYFVNLDDDYARTHLEANPGPYVVLSVTDTGHGMDEATRQRIFEPFFTTKDLGKGSGLGLSIVYGIVKGHGGHITCYSTPGKGSTFRVYLPTFQSALPSRPETPGEAEQFPLEGTETVLIVEDEPAILEAAVTALRYYGYNPLPAASGEEALKIYTEQRGEIDVVVLDVGMPGMGGEECFKRIMALDPTAKVIIASGYSPNGVLKDLLASGPAGFIAKPYRLSELARTIRQVLDSSPS